MLDSRASSATPKKNADLFYAVSASYNTVALLTNGDDQLEAAPAYVNLSIDRVESLSWQFEL